MVVITKETVIIIIQTFTNEEISIYIKSEII
jgi:hypothetical protein